MADEFTQWKLRNNEIVVSVIINTIVSKGRNKETKKDLIKCFLYFSVR